MVVGGGVIYKFVDDRDIQISIKSLKDEIIGGEYCVFVCGGEIFDTLINNCKKCRIPSQLVVDGREFVVFGLSEILIKESKNIEKGKHFSFLENGNLYVSENILLEYCRYMYVYFGKYLGADCLDYLCYALRIYCDALKRQIEAEGYIFEFNTVCLEVVSVAFRQGVMIQEFLSERRVDYTLIYHSIEDYSKSKRMLSDKNFLIVPWIIIEYFAYCKIGWFYTSMFPKLSSRKQIIVGCGHDIKEGLDYSIIHLKDKYISNHIKITFSAFDYYLSTNKKSHLMFQEIFKNCNLNTIPIAAGSPIIDERVKRYGEFCVEVQSFYFLPRTIDIYSMTKLIKELLNAEQKVVFRLHPNAIGYNVSFNRDIYAPIKLFLEDSNFIIDESFNVNDELLRSGIVITDISSVAYSIPWLSLKPVILYATNHKEYNMNQARFGVSFVDELLHVVATDPKEAINKALWLKAEILKDKGVSISNEIKKYRSRILYNFGRSKEIIESVLFDLLEKDGLG